MNYMPHFQTIKMIIAYGHLFLVTSNIVMSIETIELFFVYILMFWQNYFLVFILVGFYYFTYC